MIGTSVRARNWRQTSIPVGVGEAQVEQHHVGAAVSERVVASGHVAWREPPPWFALAVSGGVAPGGVEPLHGDPVRGGAVAGLVAALVVTLNLHILVGLEQGYAASPSEVFEYSTVLGLFDLLLVVAPVLGVLGVGRLRRRHR